MRPEIENLVKRLTTLVFTYGDDDDIAALESLRAKLDEADKELIKRNKTYEEASLIVAENMALRCENNLLKKELKALEALRKPLE